jgi:hypothetical protein
MSWCICSLFCRLECCLIDFHLYCVITYKIKLSSGPASISSLFLLTVVVVVLCSCSTLFCCSSSFSLVFPASDDSVYGVYHQPSVCLSLSQKPTNNTSRSNNKAQRSLAYQFYIMIMMMREWQKMRIMRESTRPRQCFVVLVLDSLGRQRTLILIPNARNL